MKKQAIVTGAAGFIGSHLCDALVGKGYTVTGIDNLSTGNLKNLASLESKSFRFVEADISNNFADVFSASINAEYFFHLAALADIVPSINRPGDYFEANVQGTFNVLELARKMKVKKFVYAASSSCYGIPEVFPTPETSQISPMYPYALTKYLGEELVLHWNKVFNVPAISLRLFNVYGPRARTSGSYGAVFGVFLAQKSAGKPFTVVGDGNQTRDFTYVSDVVNAFILAAESGIKGEIYNVGSGSHYSINQLVNLLGGEIVRIPKRPGEPNCTFANTAKILSELGWSPKMSFQEGVVKMMSEIEEWKDAPVWTPRTIEKETELWFKYLSDRSAKSDNG